nr:protein FAM160A1 [Hymenolepis microstoma]
MSEADAVFDSRLKSCLARISSKKFDLKNVEDTFNDVEYLFKCFVNEKPPVDGANANSETVCDNLPLGPLAIKLIESDYLSRLLSWCTALECPQETNQLILHRLLENFDFLISQAKQSLLFSNVIFQPILKLIDACQDLADPFLGSLSHLLYTLSVLLCRDPILLEFSKQVSRDVTRNEYFIFSSLVPLLHLPGSSGSKARDALLLILQLSDRDTEVANYLTCKSDICPVLATSLSGYYSCLPKRLVFNGVGRNGDQSALYVRGEGWHRITRPEWSECEVLVQFLQTLDFCNLAVRISHQSVRQYLLYYIYSGFLMSVLRSTLNQQSLEEVTAAEAYLELFLRRLTEPSLIGLFLRFIVASTDEDESVLSSLINRLSANSTGPGDENYELGMVTLSLFRTILNLNCEDIMFLLVFQYLNKLDFVVVDNAVALSEVKKRGAIYLPNADNLSWLASSERFSKLSFWCTGYADPLLKYPKSERGYIKYAPPDRVAGCLLASHCLINIRTRGTEMWSSEYGSPQLSLGPTTSVNDSASAPLHSTPIRTTQMTSSLRVEPDPRHMAEVSLIDKYKSESNLYQLSYLDDSDEETDRDTKKSHASSRPTSELKSSELPADFEIAPKPDKCPLDAIRRFLVEINGKSTSDAIFDFIQVLANDFTLTSEEEGYRNNIPYPPVSQFVLDMLDYRLGLKSIPEIVPPISPLRRQRPSPQMSNLETEYDFDGLYGNELPELPFRSTLGQSSSPRHVSSQNIGPFLTCLLHRIGSMHENCLYTNLLLTDIVLILASFHQFPLADVLLRCPELPFKTSSQSLYQVLICLRRELEKKLTRIPDWHSLVDQAMRFLRRQNLRNPEVALPSAVAMAVTPNFASKEDILAMDRSRNTSLRAPSTPQLSQVRSPLPSRPPVPPMVHQRSSSAAPRTAVLEPTVTIHSPPPNKLTPQSRSRPPRRSSIDRLSHLLSHLGSPILPRNPDLQTPPPSRPLPPSDLIPTGTRNLIFAYVVFSEFCLELAALACEHEVSAASVQPQFEKTLDLEGCLAEF